MEHEEVRMLIGELAAAARVSVKAVRYYESLGLLTPGRLANGYRDYREDDVRVVREIRALADLGIPVERTRPFLDCLAAGHDHPDDCASSLAEYRTAIAEVSRRINGLTARRATLIAHLERAARRGVHHPRAEARAHPTDYTSLPSDLPVPEDDGAAAHLPGTPMPDLTLTTSDGAEVDLARLGPARTVIYLYPLTGRPGVDLPDGWDAIPGARGCSTEACGFRDHFRELLDAGVVSVFGLSSQTPEYQREVVDRLHLPFPMLADPRLELARTLRLPTFTTAGVDDFRRYSPGLDDRLYARLTMIVRGGVIEHVFYPIFPPDRHADQVLAWLGAHPV